MYFDLLLLIDFLSQSKIVFVFGFWFFIYNISANSILFRFLLIIIIANGIFLF